MPREVSQLVATLVGVALSLITTAATQLGAPTGVWIAAAILGLFAFAAAAVLYLTEAPLKAPEAKRSDRRSLLSPASRNMVMGLSTIGAVGLAVFLGLNLDRSPGRGHTVIVCIDSSASTDRVRTGYLPDLESVVLDAAEQEADFYAADCGHNATGTVDWPVRRQFRSHGGGFLAQHEALLQAEETVRDGLRNLVEVRSTAGGPSLGEVLATMGRQCGQAGGDCTLYIFTDGEWNDDVLRTDDGVSGGERKTYLETYLPLLDDLAGSEVNFVGVGDGTGMGAVHLGETHELASALVEGAGAKIGTWTTRL